MKIKHLLFRENCPRRSPDICVHFVRRLVRSDCDTRNIITDKHTNTVTRVSRNMDRFDHIQNSLG